MIIKYQNNTGNTSSSTGTNDFLLGAALTYHINLSTLVNQYIPYYIQHDSLNEWEYGLGTIILSGSDHVLVRGGSGTYTNTTIYTSSNNSSKVSFSAGSKSVYAVISAERILHGGNNYTTQTTNFSIVDDAQTIYGVVASGSDITASLPSASGLTNLVLGFRILEQSTHNVIIQPSGSEHIDGSGFAVTLSPSTKYTSFISDGSGWLQLNHSIDIDSAGLPDGNTGNIQFKDTSTDFGSTESLHWDNSNKLLLLGDSVSGTANVVIPTTSGSNTIFNQNGYDSDFIVYGTGSLHKLHFDASTGRLGINTTNPSTILHIVGRCANENFRLESISNCPTGVGLTLYHNPQSGSSVGDYPAFINLAGRNSNGERIQYGKISSRILGTLINQTSGELIFSVDYLGNETNIITTSPVRTTIGLDSATSEQYNVSIGNFITNSGTDSIVVGHNASIANTSSNHNIIIAHSGDVTGDNCIIIGSADACVGDKICVFGQGSSVNGDNSVIAGNNNDIDGSDNFILGLDNAITGDRNFIYGSDNISSNNDGIVFGTHNHNASGVLIGHHISNTGNNIVFGEYSSAIGNNNDMLGTDIDIRGHYNTSFGNSLNISGSGNNIVGSNISTTGNNNIIIAKSLDVSSKNNSVIIGYTSQDLVIDDNTLSINSGLGISNINIYSNSPSSGLFIRNNKIGINTQPTGAFTLDVSGSGQIQYLTSQGFRLGNSTTSGYILISDSSGNANWGDINSVATNVTSGLLPQSLVTFDGSKLVSASGFYWSNTSGVMYSAYSNVIIPTGNNTFVINNNKFSNLNTFRIKGSIRDDLFVADTLNDRLGINVSLPARTIDASGSFRVYSDSFDFIQKTDDSFVIAYDNGVAQNNRFNFTPSGIMVQQTAAEPQILGPLTYAASYPSTSTTSSTFVMVFDDATDMIRRRSTLVAGFDTFNGVSDN